MNASGTDGFAVVKPGQTYQGKQGITYGAGASKETVGAEKIRMNVMPMPPGARAKAHYHDKIETIAYLLDGECAVYYGDDLERRVVISAGDHVFCPADVPHANHLPCIETATSVRRPVCRWRRRPGKQERRVRTTS